jgi:hypothetical protein
MIDSQNCALIVGSDECRSSDHARGIGREVESTTAPFGKERSPGEDSASAARFGPDSAEIDHAPERWSPYD